MAERARESDLSHQKIQRFRFDSREGRKLCEEQGSHLFCAYQVQYLYDDVGTCTCTARIMSYRHKISTGM